MSDEEQITMAGNPKATNVFLNTIEDVRTPKKSQHYTQLKKSIGMLGMLVPVILRSREGQPHLIISGRRRIAAARELNMKTVPAMLYHHSVHESFIPSATIAENAIRSDNMAADIESVRTLRDQGCTAATIESMTGMPVRDVMRLLDLLALPDEIIGGVQDGTIAQSTADQLRKSTPETIASTLDVYRENGKLTLADVRNARSTGYQAATATLDLPEIESMGMTLRDQIIAVLDDPELNYEQTVKAIDAIVRPRENAL